MNEMEVIDLDQLIQDRREEKREILRDKIQNELRNIRDRKLGRVIQEPFPEGVFEILDCNNIWEIVLGFLTDPSDVTNAYFACGTFARILEQRRMRLLFAQALNVFKITADKFFKEHRVWSIDKGNIWHDNWKTILLNVRGVSKAWMKTADFELFDRNLQNDDWFMDWEWRRHTAVTFSSEQSVDRVMNLLAYRYARGQTRSLIRNVRVYVNDRKTQLFFMKLMEFLWTHGKHVWSFLFACGNNTRNICDIYERFRGMLELMPNLKDLYFSIGTGTDQGAGAGEEFQDFQRRLNERPLPSLLSLEHLSCGEKTDKSLLSQMIRKSVNLKSLELPYELPDSDDALMTVSLQHYSGPLDPITSNRIIWPLMKLRITDSANASLLFPAINRFRDTLQNLHPGYVQMDSRDVRLDLPHLKVLEILMMDSEITTEMQFDDLLPLRTLERIRVGRFLDEDENVRVKVQEYMKSGKMEKSNVWQCFPHLKSLYLRSIEGWLHRPPNV